jgi:hypothetical protein
MTMFFFFSVWQVAGVIFVCADSVGMRTTPRSSLGLSSMRMGMTVRLTSLR